MSLDVRHALRFEFLGMGWDGDGIHGQSVLRTCMHAYMWSWIALWRGQRFHGRLGSGQDCHGTATAEDAACSGPKWSRRLLRCLFVVCMVTLWHLVFFFGLLMGETVVAVLEEGVQVGYYAGNAGLETGIDGLDVWKTRL